MLSGRSRTQKATQCVSPFYVTRSGQAHPDRKWICDCWELGRGIGMGMGLLFGGAE